MNETKFVMKCREVLEAELPGCFLWKICDRMTGGLPDLFVAWEQATTMLEFKLLKKDETVHDKWEDGRQLVTCVQLERATGRCWVVAFKRASHTHDQRLNQTLIYRPSALLDRKIPVAKQSGLFDVRLLWEQGVLQLSNYDHDAIAQLIKLTHA